MKDADADRGRLLRTWKEIGEHLKVSDRTARSWQAEGIPVYRDGEGRRPTVVAYTAELEAWQRQRAMNGGPASSNPVRWRYVVGIGLGLVTVFWLALTASKRDTPGDPERVVFTAEGFDLRNARDESIRFVEISGLSVQEYRSLTREPKAHQFDQLIRDIDGDGKVEVFVSKHLPQDKNDEICRIDHDGSLSWTFSFKPLERRDRVFSAFKARIVGLVQPGARPYLVVLGTSKKWYPSRIALLDPRTGAQVGADYAHPGLIQAIALYDLDRNGVEEIVFSGANNPGEGVGHAFLAILRVPFPEPASDQRDFFGRSGPKETTYILFPRPDILEVKKLVPSACRFHIFDDERIVVDVGYEMSYIEYTFDRELNLLRADPADYVHTLHAELQEHGALAHPVSDAERNHWLTNVVRFSTAPDGNSAEVVRRLSERGDS